MKTWLCIALWMASGAASAASLTLDGEVYSQRSALLMPPPVDELYQFNVTQLAPDGSTVKQGQVVVTFDTSELTKSLAEKTSKLQEKQRELDKLVLDQASRARTEHLATEQARAELDKAQRKTQQPQELIAGVEYRKLVNARTLAQRSFALAQQTETAQTAARTAERHLLDAETRQLQNEVERLRTGLESMQLIAPRDGLIMHKSGFDGEKFDVGSQVWKGQSVAEIPDLSVLAVRAQLPERDYQQVHIGQAAKVRLEGSGAVFPARVLSIARAVRSKSNVQPIPILDVEITLDKADPRLKPGMSVRVDVDTTKDPA
ncbi:Multidrug resistance efflux pump [Pseudoxanthomonas sp. GM95]|uniref:HlyD family secretion protein n=1 Tax=Pseudoxanthomonas sp. GM95 TaxID=1881043 RepID=UPI0008C5A28E|nr:efflux RND transporter periplasmic adaptor subunit [Pseudoxanthomonas sp. GM95]SEM16064.1 Multidrug resistance efflux pump [Pseudoxanthomonas sp. GM95]